MGNQIVKRNQGGNEIQDPGILENLMYNNAAGGRKSLQVGGHYLPLPDGAGGFTTDATTARALPGAGKNVAVFNKSATTTYAITFGESSTQAALGVGATDVSGHVGIPCSPNQWTYLSSGNSQWVITSNNNLVVLLLDDNTYITPQSNFNAST